MVKKKEGKRMCPSQAEVVCGCRFGKLCNLTLKSFTP